MLKSIVLKISDHQRSWGYEDGPWKGPEPPLLVAADFLNVWSSFLAMTETEISESADQFY